MKLMSLVNTYKKPLSKLLKILVSCVALGYIIFRVSKTNFSQKDFENLLHLPLISSILLLTVLNWLFESYKWKTVVNTFANTSIKRAVKETLISYTYGMITPFNSGNYLKKISFYPKKHSGNIIFLNVIKGIYQMLTTIAFGIWGVWVLLENIKGFKLNNPLFLVALFFGFLILGFIFKKQVIGYLNKLTPKIHLSLILLSVAKYVSFALVLTLLFYSTDKSTYSLFAGIACVYLFSSLLPILNLLDFAIKGSVALFIFTPLGYSEATILINYFILWISNHAAPAIFGSVLQFYKPKS